MTITIKRLEAQPVVKRIGSFVKDNLSKDKLKQVIDGHGHPPHPHGIYNNNPT